jgi:hypothetical protein
VACGEVWVPLERCLADLDGVLDANLADCCAFQGGFFIVIDGRPWSTDGTVDGFGMTVTWFSALRQLWSGSAQARVWAWEESRLTLTRQGDELEMEDIHHSGAVAMPRVRVPFAPFSAAIVREGRPFARLVKGLQATIAQRLQADPAPEVERKLHVLAGSLVPPDFRHDLEFLEAALAHDTP